ncbi:hypothetical protein [Calycomorphotria hydatis]|uniref:Uncharacterized protein n=1 Tax=Calycomorphotria hydatis TaxID=2528027 RepID=A0A517TBZ1_9PLAN|nr:hypothetical protein [Calycomorphotria hydatis]QDT65884.1 hypothetical protein V22_31470 [Calycomorphotria hydatis]
MNESASGDFDRYEDENRIRRSWLIAAFVLSPGFSCFGGILIAIGNSLLQMFHRSEFFFNDSSGYLALGLIGIIPSAFGVWVIGLPVWWILKTIKLFHPLSVAITGIIISTGMLTLVKGGIPISPDFRDFWLTGIILTLTWSVIFGFCLFAFWVPQWLIHKNKRSA